MGKKLSFIVLLLLSFLCRIDNLLGGEISSINTQCFDFASERFQIPKELLLAIAKVESNFNQKAINYNIDGTYDVGVMQINSSWRRVLGNTRWKKVVEDACYNILIGAWILNKNIERYGRTWEAVGTYNAKSKKKKVIYISKVRQALREQELNKEGEADTNDKM